MVAPICGPLAVALESGRARFNAQFAHARHNMPQLDGERFGQHLRRALTPVVDAVAAASAEQVEPVVDALFEVSLELVGRDLMSRYPVLTDGWQQLLAALAPQLAAEPQRVAASVTNALCNLSREPGARPRQWIAALERIAALSPSPTVLLEAGQVAAWGAGMAYYRLGALEICGRLEPPVVAAALGVERLASDALERMRGDPWAPPTGQLVDQPVDRGLAIVGRVGAFRGFGGPFMQPPKASLADGELLLSDGDSHLLLSADRFGVTLRRTEPPDSRRRARKRKGGARFERGGVLRWGGFEGEFPELTGRTSAVTDGHTLVVTTALSHAATLIAVVDDPSASSQAAAGEP